MVLRQRARVGAALAVVLIGTMGASKACSTSSKVVNQSPGSAGAPASKAPAHLGGTITLSNGKDKLAVTAVAGFKAAPENPDLGASAGKHFVGIKFMLANAGQSTVTGNVNNGGTITGSDNQTYNADFSSIAGCTNFNQGDFTLAPGASSTGCVTYQVPDGVTVKKIDYNPTFLGGQSAEWLVP